MLFFGHKTSVSCILHRLETSVERAFVNQPQLANLDASQLAFAEQESKVLQAVTTISSSHLQRWAIF